MRSCAENIGGIFGLYARRLSNPGPDSAARPQPENDEEVHDRWLQGKVEVTKSAGRDQGDD